MKRKKGIWILIVGMVVILCQPPSTEFLDIPYSSILYDRSGTLLSARIATDGQWRFPLSKLESEKFEKTLITFEDHRFYYHPGVDPIALTRAIYQNIRAGEIISGASTLSMQLARLSRGSRQRTIWNKLVEMHLAFRFELWYSKNQILNWYTSLAPFGGNVVGLEAACWRYFNKSPKQLTWAEASMLAVLPNAPSLIHVNKNRNRLLQKRDQLLVRLFENGKIDSLDLEAALSEPLPSTTYALPNFAPHYLEYLKINGANIFHSDLVQDIQVQSGQILNDYYPLWKANEIYNAAAVIRETKTGKVVAYHGNIPATSEEAWVDIVQARRSSGSVLKPFLFAHQLDEGLMSPFQLTEDIPTFISGFNPTNYNRSYSGAIPSDEALQQSLNIPAVRQLQGYGVGKFLHYLREHGFSALDRTPDHYGLSLILGGGEISLWELVQAYQKMGAQLLGEELPRDLSRASIYQTFEALKGLSRPDEAGNWQVMDSRFPVAWKTGTSYGHRDAWAVGVTPDYTIATWVGNADGEGRDGIVGVGTAGKLLFSLFDICASTQNWFEPPYEEMGYLNICSESGFLTNPFCPDTSHIFLPLNVEMSAVCPHHRPYFTDLEETFRVDPGCREVDNVKRTIYLELSPEVASYYASSHPEFRRIPPVDPDCISTSMAADLSFTYPHENEVVFLPTDLNQNQQKLIAKVVHRQPETRLFWYINEEYLGSTEVFHTMSLHPGYGKHTLLVEDIYGNRIHRNFEIANRLHP